MYEVWIDIIDDCTGDVWVILEHMKQHCTTTNKRLNISYILKIVEIGWQ